MKYFVRHLFMGLMIVALAGVMAFGKDKIKSASVTFPADVMLNGTSVKAGNYKVRFNEQTGELTILKGNKVVAKTMAHLEDRADEAQGTRLRFRDSELVSVTFGGDRHDVVVSQGNSTTGNQ
jgi:hypothetical protein